MASWQSRNAEVEYWWCQCGSWQWAQKKKCARCGIKKAWGQVQRPEAPQYSTPPWRSEAWSPQSHGAHTESSQAAPKDSVTAPVVIKHFGSALLALPDEECYAEARASVAKQIADKKKAITLSKPLASQLAGASAAWERAKTKVERAEAALLTATAEVESARAAEVQLASEVAEIQAKVTAYQPPEDCISSMTSGMTSVLEDMRKSGRVSGEIMTGAEQAMAKLVNDIRDVAARARAQEQRGAELAPAAPLSPVVVAPQAPAAGPAAAPAASAAPGARVPLRAKTNAQDTAYGPYGRAGATDADAPMTGGASGSQAE